MSQANTATNGRQSDPWTVPVGGGGGGDYVCCPAGTHMATIVGLYDVGTLPEPDRERGGEKLVRKLVVALELAKKRPDGNPFVLAVKYTFSMSEKANLFKVVTSIIGRKLRDGEQFSPVSLLGVPVMVSVSNTGEGEKVYHDVSGISQFPEGMAVPVPSYRPLAWSSSTDEPFPDGLDWLPKVYGKTVRQLAESSVEHERRHGKVGVPGGDADDVPPF